MTHDTYVISKINGLRDIKNIEERFTWIYNHKELMDTNIIITFDYPGENVDASVCINATENIEHKKCTIAILSTYDRKHFLLRLLWWIRNIITDDMAKKFTILVNISDKNISVGEKRNNLVKSANSDYMCFVDDDDMISPTYFLNIDRALSLNPDAVGIMGKIYYLNEEGTKPNHIIPFIHSNANAKGIISQNETGKFVTVGHVFPFGNKDLKDIDEPMHCSIITHLCPMKMSIVKTFSFEDKYYNEDLPWARKIFDSGLVKNEILIEENIYQYLFRGNKIGENNER